MFLLHYKPKRIWNWKQFWLKAVGYRSVNLFTTALIFTHDCDFGLVFSSAYKVSLQRVQDNSSNFYTNNYTTVVYLDFSWNKTRCYRARTNQMRILPKNLIQICLVFAPLVTSAIYAYCFKILKKALLQHLCHSEQIHTQALGECASIQANIMSNKIINELGLEMLFLPVTSTRNVQWCWTLVGKL